MFRYAFTTWASLAHWRFLKHHEGQQTTIIISLPHHTACLFNLLYRIAPTRMSRQNCTNCLKDVPLENYHTHEAYCLRYILRCQHCLQTYDKKEPQNHLSLHELVLCNQCGEKHERRLLQHHRKSCPGNRMECQFCHIPIRSSEFIDHIVECGGRTQQCDACGKFVTLREKQSHQCGQEKLKEEFANTTFGRLKRKPQVQQIPQTDEAAKLSKMSTGKSSDGRRDQKGINGSNSQLQKVVSMWQGESASAIEAEPKRPDQSISKKSMQEQQSRQFKEMGTTEYDEYQDIEGLGEEFLQQAIEQSKMEF